MFFCIAARKSCRLQNWCSKLFKLIRIHRHDSFGIVASEQTFQRILLIQPLKVRDLISSPLQTLCLICAARLLDLLDHVSDRLAENPTLTHDHAA